MTDILLGLPLFALVLFRLGGLVMTAPLLASAVIPLRIRAAAVFAMAAMIFPLAAGSAPQEVTLSMVIAGGVMEVMIGAAMGLALSMFLLAAEVAGQLVGQQAGLSMGEIIDPTQNLESSVVGQMYAVSLTLLFLLAGGHRAMVAALLDTFEVIPLLSYAHSDSMLLLLVEMLTAAFMVGVQVAAPATIAVFLSGTALAFLSRTMPQLNILTVGFSLRALTAVGVAGIALGSCQKLFMDALWDGLILVRLAFGLDPAALELSN